MPLLTTETLLTPSSIKLFGRVVSSLTYNNDTANTGLGDNKFLQRQLEANGDNPPTLARIYAFSFEGAYYELPRPPIFLVHGSGTPVGSWANPSTVAQAGVAARDWDFSGNYDPTYNPGSSAGSARTEDARSRKASPPPPPPSTTDIYYWEYEKGDFSLRLDVEAGPFEQILLQMALRGGGGVSGAGVSGAGVSGAGVSGAGVSGAGVSGAGVSGAGVSGAGVRR
jgi:hypothetical protein